MKLYHITPKFRRLANVATVASIDNSYNIQLDLVAAIRQIVREEMKRLAKGTDVEQLCRASAPN